MSKKTKFELTWIDKENRPKLEHEHAAKTTDTQNERRR